MDFGTDDDIAYTRTDVQHDLWVLALRTAKPGQVSRGSWILFSIAYGLIANTVDYIGACRQEWPETAHKRDWRMLSGAPRETPTKRWHRCLPEATAPKRPSRQWPISAPPVGAERDRIRDTRD